ncbi:MAG: hypothetical protein NVS1B2_26950 [Vulcanimicrobiaceae bacterium]
MLNTAYHLAGTISAMPVGAALQFYERRGRFNAYDRARGADHPVLKVLDDLAAARFLGRDDVFTTDRFVALTWQPPSEMRSRFQKALSRGVDAMRRTENEMLAEFADLCARCDSSFRGVLRCERLGETTTRDAYGVAQTRSDLLRFVRSCVLGDDSPVAVPAPGIALNATLSTDVRGGFDVRIGDDELGCIELDALPEQVTPRILDGLAELKVAHTLCVRVVAQSVVQSKKGLKDAVLDFQGAAGFHAGFVDPGATADSIDALAAYGEAGGDYTRVGRASIVIVVRAATRALVKRAQRDVLAVLKDAAFVGTVRDLGAFSTWLGTLPSDLHHGVRKYPLTAISPAKLFPIHETSMGRRFAESESLPPQTPALLYALRPGNTLYRAHLNVADVFHGFGIGRTTSGKSVLATKIALMFRSRYPLAGVTIIDNGRSARPGCELVDGTFLDLLGPASPGFALFSDSNDPERERERLQIIEEMVELQRGSRVTPDENAALVTANRVIGSMPPEHRSLSAFYELVQDPGGNLRPALLPYTRRGDLGAVLDASEDVFAFSRFNVIDVARVMSLPPKYLVPIMRVLVWKTQAQIAAMKRALGPRGHELHWLISIDESHKITQTEIGSRFVVELQKMGRRSNIGVWLWSNGLSEFVKSPARNDLLMNSPTRVFFGDSAVTPSDLETIEQYKNLQLPGHGIARLGTLAPRTVLWHQPEADILVELDVSMEADELALVGTSRDNDAIDRARAAHRDGERWRHAYLTEKGAFDAASRYGAMCERSMVAR